jgi:phosphoribosyl-AMP cyclohydrolase
MWQDKSSKPECQRLSADIETTSILSPKWDEQGLIAAVATDCDSGEVLMLAWMNAEALDATIDTRKAHFWSRSRKALWMKGETSGNVLDVEEIRIDCDQDAVWLKCRPAGPACHTGERSCFYRVVDGKTLLHD